MYCMYVCIIYFTEGVLYLQVRLCKADILRIDSGLCSLVPSISSLPYPYSDRYISMCSVYKHILLYLDKSDILELLLLLLVSSIQVMLSACCGTT